MYKIRCSLTLQPHYLAASLLEGIDATVNRSILLVVLLLLSTTSGDKPYRC